MRRELVSSSIELVCRPSAWPDVVGGPGPASAAARRVDASAEAQCAKTEAGGCSASTNTHRACAARDQNPSRGVWNMRAKFYLDLVRSPFRYRDAPQRLRIAALLLFSQLPNALGFFAERRRDRKSRGDRA